MARPAPHTLPIIVLHQLDRQKAGATIKAIRGRGMKGEAGGGVSSHPAADSRHSRSLRPIKSGLPHGMPGMVSFPVCLATARAPGHRPSRLASACAEGARGRNPGAPTNRRIKIGYHYSLRRDENGWQSPGNHTYSQLRHDDPECSRAPTAMLGNQQTKATERRASGRERPPLNASAGQQSERRRCPN